MITLGIIGVVAALTLPSLVASYQEKVIVTKLKKIYSVFAQASLQAQEEHGPINTWFTGTDGTENGRIFFENLQPYLKIVKDCGSGSSKGSDCLTPGYIKLMNGTPYNNYAGRVQVYSFILADGAAISLEIDKPQCAPLCGYINIDVDGPKKGPYTFGKDYFFFLVSKDGIEPRCIGSPYGWGECAAAWVIFNENMDYLHCDDLSWGGKTRCN